MGDDTVSIAHEEIRAMLAERVRIARLARRDSTVQADIDRLCETCLRKDEVYLGMALALLSNLRTAHATDRALVALFELHAEVAPHALRGADPN